jgi:hypothetical protein
MTMDENMPMPLSSAFVIRQIQYSLLWKLSAIYTGGAPFEEPELSFREAPTPPCERPAGRHGNRASMAF